MSQCGTINIDYVDLKRLPLPEAMSPTHIPVPHFKVADYIRSSIKRRLGAFSITNEQYGISHEGNRCFGLMSLKNRDSQDDYEVVHAFRNSNDMAFSAKVGTGSRVFVSDNFAMSSENEIGAKHTSNVNKNLVKKLYSLNACLIAQGDELHIKYRAYKQFEMNDKMADHFIMESVRQGALQKTKIDLVYAEWKDPKYEEFKPRTGWSLFNAHMEINKGSTIKSKYNALRIYIRHLIQLFATTILYKTLLSCGFTFKSL